MVDCNKVHDVPEKVVDNAYLADNDGQSDDDNKKVCYVKLYHIFVCCLFLISLKSNNGNSDISSGILSTLKV